MIKLTSPLAVVVLAAMVAMGPLATSMYLPAFPAMAETFGVGADEVQLTLSAYMIGLAVAQLLCGPLADRFGRKPLLLTGMALFCLGSVGCTFADSIDRLFGYRFLQAFGAASGMVLAQAMVRDTFEPIDAAKKLAYMGSTVAVAPALAPVVGGTLLVAFGWPSIFLVLALYAALTLAIVSVGLPESLPRDRRQPLHPRTVSGNYLAVIGNRAFLAHALAVSLMFAGHYGFMSGAPFVLIELFDVPEARFGWYFLFVVVAFITGNLLGARLTARVGGHRLILAGGSLLVLAGALLVTFTMSGTDAVAAIIGPQVIYGIGSGMMMPQLIAGALAPFQHMAGTAASLLGFIQMGSAAASSALVGRLYDGTALPMVLVIGLAGASALVIYLALVGRPTLTPQAE
ncbi:MFS transporter, DHA1 family, bicyclomycin/chloramphenicol resistance protein [Modicisalibacter muralis]|uniref:Bcr/CflA family efflux transporter n=1 Tax=Modicisalibacter muralis TaxID=119000 RepID=A0A1G9KMH1_9GAMM|nr:multidrug effflux MFS transporter [Halomonas muralis]SDL50663.1 MFS transporter, DHA1 family, bicyclomycin/chloramphenicol resistance protein [Halomonas muralis]